MGFHATGRTAMDCAVLGDHVVARCYFPSLVARQSSGCEASRERDSSRPCARPSQAFAQLDRAILAPSQRPRQTPGVWRGISEKRQSVKEKGACEKTLRPRAPPSLQAPPFFENKPGAQLRLTSRSLAACIQAAPSSCSTANRRY